MEMARGVAEHKTLFHVGSQGNFIGEVKVCLNGQCAAIYEGIAVMGVDPSDSTDLPQFTVSYRRWPTRRHRGGRFASSRSADAGCSRPRQ